MNFPLATTTSTLHKSLSWSSGLNNCSKSFFNNSLSRQHQINKRRKMVNFESQQLSHCSSSTTSLSSMANSSITSNACTCKYFSSNLDGGRRESTSDSYLLKSSTNHSTSQNHNNRRNYSTTLSIPQRVLPRTHNPQSLLSLIRTVMDSEDSTSSSGDESPKKCKLHKQFQSTESLSLPTESQLVINIPVFTVNCLGFLRTQIHKFVKYFNNIFNKTMR